MFKILSSILVLASLGIFQSASAQNFVYSPKKDHSSIVEVGRLITYQSDFLPDDSSDITFKWKQLQNTIDSAWSYSLCDYQNCYVGIPDSGVMGTLSTAEFRNGISGMFQLVLDTDDEPRTATVQLYVYDSRDISVGDTVTFHLQTIPEDTGSPAGLNLKNIENTVIRPNPAQDQIFVQADVQEVKLMNINGQEMAIRPEAKDDGMLISVGAFDRGIYFLKYEVSGKAYVRKVILN